MAGDPPVSLPDAEVRRRAATDFDTNLVVLAGAGTGKTSLLVERALNAIGSGVASASALAALSNIAFPDTVTVLAQNTTTIPNPIGGSWVVPVSDFGAPLQAVMSAKIVAVVTPGQVPVPAPLLLLSLGMLGLVAARRKLA